MSDNPDERCYHGNTPLEGCSLCAEEKLPSSELERLLAGSVAVQELAKLRKSLSVYSEWLESTMDDMYSHANCAKSASEAELWSARAAQYHMAKQKLKSLLGDK